MSVQIVFRAMRNKAWTKGGDGRATPSAFLRREAVPEKQKEAEAALSFDVESRLSCHNALITCFGVAELDANGFGSIGLTLTLDDHPPAILSGMPLPSEDRTLAEYFASQLAKMSKLVLPHEYLPSASS